MPFKKGMKPPTGSWKKGQSGNPKGRPKKGLTWLDYAKEGDIRRAYKLLVEQMINNDDEGHGTAARYFLDQTFGTAAQKKKIEAEVKHIVQIYLPEKDKQ